MVKISNITERELISHIVSLIRKKNKKIIAGPGDDDCAIIDVSDKELLVITTDMLHTSRDFSSQMTPWQIGWMSVAVNLSDIASKGANPYGLLMAIGIPPNTELSFIDEIIKGMNHCATKYGANILGGDIDEHQELTITGTCFGFIEKENLILRNRARIRDLVCITGYPGRAGLSLIMLNKGVFDKNILKPLFEPIPRIIEGKTLAKTRLVTSMTDTSDGIAMSLYDLSKANQKGFKIYDYKIPIHKDINSFLNKDEIMDIVIYSGGDFELLFTIPPDKLDIVKRVCDFTVIGEVIENGVYIEINRKLTEISQKML